MTDIEIARSVQPQPLETVAERVGLEPGELLYYGYNKAKIDRRVFDRVRDREDGKLILVSAITPTAAGEGKTTVSIGLADGLRRIGKRTVAALREPSMGPVFGVKGGATGGGYAQVIPMEEINLHFTGDLHAISAANNLLAAMVDNHIYHGNELDIQRVVWRRCLDMNDRQLRNVESGRGGKTNGVPRDDGFDITAASEVMATLCLCDDPQDLEERLGRLIVGYNSAGDPVRAAQLNATGAMSVLLREAINPNLVQTLEGTPVLIHGGPFANIAHGCSTVQATRLARKLADYTVTEAGFGADLGAEKFLDIKCRQAGLWPNACVLVATVRALKSHGGAPKEALATPDLAALEAGLCNLTAHIETLHGAFGLPLIVALNRFVTDSEEELEMVRAHCEKLGVRAVPAEVWAKGGAGALELAQAVVEAAESSSGEPNFLYPDEMPLADKIRTVAKKVYGADDVAFSEEAEQGLARLTELGMGSWPVCMAKTQMSLSDDAKKRGRPTGFTLRVRQVRASAGAGFVVALTGTIVTMPGLSKRPAAVEIGFDENGQIKGLF
ncbi:MAG: formate--tetrahydrofolate ligase [Clostridia bacterium]|nr:formate--tetrahydrofolate ligase [Clostridia bacterium]